MTRQIPQSPVHSTHVISTTAEPPISNHAFHVLPRLNTSKIWRRTPLRTTVSRHLRQPTSCRPDHPTETAGKRAQGPSDSTGRHALQMKHPWDRDGNCGDCNLDSTRQRKLDKGETKTENGVLQQKPERPGIAGCRRANSGLRAPLLRGAPESGNIEQASKASILACTKLTRTRQSMHLVCSCRWRTGIPTRPSSRP